MAAWHAGPTSTLTLAAPVPRRFHRPWASLGARPARAPPGPPLQARRAGVAGAHGQDRQRRGGASSPWTPVRAAPGPTALPHPRSPCGPAAAVTQARAEQEEEFFTEGTAALRDARMFLLEYSLPRARDRLEAERVDVRRPMAAAMQLRREAEARVKVAAGGPSSHAAPHAGSPSSPDGRRAHMPAAGGPLGRHRASPTRGRSSATTGRWPTVRSTRSGTRC